jgi:hypothetical protein
MLSPPRTTPGMPPVNFDDLRCKQCGKTFPAPTEGKTQRLG